MHQNLFPALANTGLENINRDTQ